MEYDIEKVMRLIREKQDIITAHLVMEKEDLQERLKKPKEEGSLDNFRDIAHIAKLHKEIEEIKKDSDHDLEVLKEALQICQKHYKDHDED